jgi:nanoRNase/pAp phosphatase (c-di-AMP/oligoRNAs hydrolase)
MNKKEKNKQIVDLFAQASSIAIIPSKLGGVDSFCAGAGLFHILNNNSKNISFIYPGRLPEGCEDIFPADKVTSNTTERDLIIAVDYNETDMEKVQYTSENGVFYLRLGPVQKDFDLKKVTAQLVGNKNDLFIIIGARMPEDLGQTYRDLERELLAGKIINLDITDRNSRFGHYNIVDPQKDSMSLLTLHTALEWDFLVNTEAAQAFLKGISHNKV